MHICQIHSIHPSAIPEPFSEDIPKKSFLASYSSSRSLKSQNKVQTLSKVFKIPLLNTSRMVLLLISENDITIYSVAQAWNPRSSTHSPLLLQSTLSVLPLDSHPVWVKIYHLRGAFPYPSILINLYTYSYLSLIYIAYLCIFFITVPTQIILSILVNVLVSISLPAVRSMGAGTWSFFAVSLCWDQFRALGRRVTKKYSPSERVPKLNLGFPK